MDLMTLGSSFKTDDDNDIREAFQLKKQRNLGISPNRGGESSKNQKKPKFQLGIV